MSNQSNVKKCRTRNPQKITSLRLLKDIKSVCRSIIRDCKKNQVDEVVVNQVDQVSHWLDQIGEKDTMGFSKQEAVEMVDILQLIHQANWAVISKALSM
jgi:hypothetical protein